MARFNAGTDHQEADYDEYTASHSQRDDDWTPLRFWLYIWSYNGDKDDTYKFLNIVLLASIKALYENDWKKEKILTFNTF